MPVDVDTAVKLAMLEKDIQHLQEEVDALKEPTPTQKETVRAIAVIGTLIGAIVSGVVAVWRVTNGEQ